ncbi:unnamed protein product, partial [Vitis vinifera]
MIHLLVSLVSPLHRINNIDPTTVAVAATAAVNCHKQSRTPLRCATPVPDAVASYHAHAVGPHQCCSMVVQTTAAALPTVWSVVRRFDNPQAYKHFLKSCHSSTERLEILDDERHVLSFSVVGGDHRLCNYRSVTTLHPSPTGTGTVVVESYVVDIPPGNTKEDTCVFVDTIVKCNLQSLAQIICGIFSG